MFKVLIFGRKRADVTWEQFFKSYEQQHLIWSKDVIAEGKMPPMLRYKRNYVRHDDPNNIGAPPDFDFVTEAVFESEVVFKASRAALADPEIRKRVTGTAAEFMDMDNLRYVVVDEYE